MKIVVAPQECAESFNCGYQLEDVELLRRHVNGCKQSFPALVRRYQRQLWWAIRNSEVPAEHHPDVLQEGLLRIHRFAHNFRGSGRASVGTWMVAIMRNVASTFCKQMSKDSSRMVAFEDFHTTAAGGADRVLKLTVLEEQTVARMDVHRALTQLAPELRDVLVHTSLRGMSIEAYAHLAGIPIGTVKSRRNRAKRHMLQLLRPEEYLEAAAG